MAEKSLIITRKFTLIPVMSDQNQYKKRLYDFTVSDLERRIERKKKAEEDTASLESQLSAVIEGGVDFDFTRQMVNDYTYSLVRTMCMEEAQKKNFIMSYIFSEMLLNDVQHMETLKEKFTFVDAALKSAYRTKGSKKGSLFDNTEIGCTLGGYGIAFNQALTGKIKDSIKAGLLEGRVVLPSYKIDSPATLAKDHFNFFHDYSSIEELQEHLDDYDCKMYLNYGGSSKTGNPASLARFRVDLGTGKNRQELKSVLIKVYTEEYKRCGSSIQISNGKIILNLCLEIPQETKDLDENVVVGVKLGITYPVMCALNNDEYKRLKAGNSEDLIQAKARFKSQRIRKQQSLRYTNGGHGRKEKLESSLSKLKKAESHYFETYAHKMSKKIVDFALKYHAKYINIEDLSVKNNDALAVSNIYKLQEYITYKANRYGIEVRTVNANLANKTCSVCGKIQSGPIMKSFDCEDPKCQSHKKYKYGFPSEFNAAKNIAAVSAEAVKKKEKKTKKRPSKVNKEETTD